MRKDDKVEDNKNIKWCYMEKIWHGRTGKKVSLEKR